ncbi:hypothetical protein GVX82_01500 [Patescibacteria group bacterium]|jgi:hypothetical protein|nr:hypothetical protein [Patescibacteria group bacterium]
MEPRFNSSFIPKAPLANESSDLPKKKRSKGGNMIPLVSGVVFIIALAATGGLLMYEQVMVSSITSKVEQLEDIQARIDPELITELERYASRIEGAQALLNAHLAPSFLQELLEGVTLADGMRFGSLEYVRHSSDSLGLVLEGQGVDLESLVLQSDALNDLFLTQELFISDITLEKSEVTGETVEVAFNARTSLVPDAMRFQDLLPEVTERTQVEQPADASATSPGPNTSEQEEGGEEDLNDTQVQETNTSTGATVEESTEPL